MTEPAMQNQPTGNFVKCRPFDPANYLKTESCRALYLEECSSDNDAEFIASAKRDIERSRKLYPPKTKGTA